MARKTITMAALAATVVTAMAPAAAMAQDRYHGGYYGYDQRQDDYRREWHGDRGYDRRQDGYAQRSYYSQSGYERSYRAPTRYSYRCQGSGTTGTILGAIAGGLLGNGVAGRGDRTLGTLLGGGVGALAGRAIDKSSSRC
jgi:hypothetical protein